MVEYELFAIQLWKEYAPWRYICNSIRHPTSDSPTLFLFSLINLGIFTRRLDNGRYKNVLFGMLYIFMYTGFGNERLSIMIVGLVLSCFKVAAIPCWLGCYMQLQVLRLYMVQTSSISHVPCIVLRWLSLRLKHSHCYTISPSVLIIYEVHERLIYNNHVIYVSHSS